MSLPPVLDTSGRPLDQIRLLGLTVRGHHGVLDKERRDGQDFGVDVVLHLDTRPAAAADDLPATVDYGRLAVALADVVRGEPVNLLETLAGRLASACLQDPRVAVADVAVHKPHAPIAEAFGDVVVAVRRGRQEARLGASTAVRDDNQDGSRPEGSGGAA
jgi:dihydroneopterin aldolase